MCEKCVGKETKSSVTLTIVVRTVDKLLKSFSDKKVQKVCKCVTIM